MNRTIKYIALACIISISPALMAMSQKKPGAAAHNWRNPGKFTPNPGAFASINRRDQETTQRNRAIPRTQSAPQPRQTDKPKKTVANKPTATLSTSTPELPTLAPAPKPALAPMPTPAPVVEPTPEESSASKAVTSALATVCTRIKYDRESLKRMAESPLSRDIPAGMQAIPGVTSVAVVSQPAK